MFQHSTTYLLIRLPRQTNSVGYTHGPNGLRRNGQPLIAGHTIAACLLPGMRARQFGRIISVISTSVKEPLKDLGVSNTGGRTRSLLPQKNSLSTP
jgi:hypothetical protein